MVKSRGEFVHVVSRIFVGIPQKVKKNETFRLLGRNKNNSNCLISFLEVHHVRCTWTMVLNRESHCEGTTLKHLIKLTMTNVAANSNVFIWIESGTWSEIQQQVMSVYVCQIYVWSSVNSSMGKGSLKDKYDILRIISQDNEIFLLRRSFISIHQALVLGGREKAA